MEKLSKKVPTLSHNIEVGTIFGTVLPKILDMDAH
jgi:hypothetical protein